MLMLLLYDAPSHSVGARSLRRFDRSISGDYRVGDRQIVASPSPLRPLNSQKARLPLTDGNLEKSPLLLTRDGWVPP